jgi:hypothetical protein
MDTSPKMERGMRPAVLAFILACGVVSARPAQAATYYLTVAGLGGEPDYEQRFAAMAAALDKSFKNSGTDAHVYTLSGNDATRVRLNEALALVASQARPEDDLVIVLIGHGSFDGVEYKFNLVGPDISGQELAVLCDRIASKRQLIVNTTSASGGSIAALQKPGRAVIAATKSGTEKNATVFARYWVDALHDPTADVDKNNAITALEAFQYAAHKSAEFYEIQKRLATEHAVFEDTGRSEAVRGPSTESGEGLLLSNFTVVRIGAAERAAADPAKRELLVRKEDLEQKIDALKYNKAAMSDEVYKQQLTESLVELAHVQQELDK